MTIKHLSIMKEVTLTLSDFTSAESVTGVFVFVVFEVYYHEDSYGYFATEKAAKRRIKSLKKTFNYNYSIAPHIVNF